MQVIRPDVSDFTLDLNDDPKDAVELIQLIEINEDDPERPEDPEDIEAVIAPEGRNTGALHLQSDYRGIGAAWADCSRTPSPEPCGRPDLG